MKSWIINVGILLAVISSCFLYKKKFASPSIADYYISSLSGIHRYLPAGSTIKIFNVVPATLVSPQREIFPHFISYVIPPSKITKKHITATDTILMLLPAVGNWPQKDSMLKHRTIIWQNKDTLYQYILIH